MSDIIIKPKRGRKSKKDLLIALNINSIDNNVQIKVDENSNNEFLSTECIQFNDTDENIIVNTNIIKMVKTIKTKFV